MEICDPICLPPIYTLEKIPVSQEDIPMNDDFRSWPHLQCIDLPAFNVDIGLIIDIQSPFRRPNICLPQNIFGHSPPSPSAVMNQRDTRLCQRGGIIALHEEGLSSRAIAARLGTTHRTVLKWIHRH
ncbi:hypothetical protein Pmani_024273 [Petrolisthes manimaculis]|uniref:Uncharacterized protein n=1 Tax=Petrolisthes manimaculis TaxID=1843537 RepID=A0AAE1U2F2_9EUCA|nr:hypothetical protein Pmani_024273 [Petrolisthes manimaculis]